MSRFLFVVTVLSLSITSFAANKNEMERKIEILSEEVEKLRTGGALSSPGKEGVHGLSPSASKVYQRNHGVSLGGYGEMLYENKASGTDRFDFVRQIIYAGYKFNPKFVFNSEIEIEHANEIFLEFGYVDYLMSPALNFRVGMLLLPMGILNELHEPTTFLGAKRTLTETSIIPSTWRENGFGVFGEIGPVSYRSYLVNGLKGSGFSGSGLRSGRQKGAQALSNDFAWVSRVDFDAIAGSTLGVSAYLGRSGQDLPLAMNTQIYDFHGDFRFRGLELRALVALALMGDPQNYNALVGSDLAERLLGYYIQAGYDLFAGGSMGLIPFVRFEKVNTQSKMPAGYVANPANDQLILTGGVSFKPIDQVVLKADYQVIRNQASTGVNQFNFALGYNF